MKKFIMVIFSVLLVCTLLGSSLGAQEKITINLFHTFWIPAQLDLLAEAIGRYGQENPNIDIVETRVSWTDAPSQLMTSIMGGTPPDIVVANPPMLAQLRGADALADITDYIPQDLKESFLKTAMDIMTNEEGRIDGIAEEGCTWAMFYRKDLFEEAGLDPNHPPASWEELVEFGKALTKDIDGDGNIDQWGYGWPAQAENATDYWENFLWQAGSEIVVYENGKWISKLTEKEAIEGTQFMVDLVRKHQISPVGLVDMNWEDVTNGFVFGKFAIMYNGAWVVSSVHDKGPEIEGKWATSPLYAGPAGRVNRGYPNTFNILKASKVKQEAWSFLEFLYRVGPDEQLSYIERIAEVAGSFIWTNHYMEYARETYESLLQPFIESTATSRIPPMTPQWQTLCDMFGDPAVQNMLLGQQGVEETLKDLEEKFYILHAEQ